MLDQYNGNQAEDLVGGILTRFESVLLLHALRNLQHIFEAELDTSMVGTSCLDSVYQKRHNVHVQQVNLASRQQSSSDNPYKSICNAGVCPSRKSVRLA